MSARGHLGATALGTLFVAGAVGGLIGDMCHVESGTTVYLEDPLPYVWKSQLWFPLMVGGGTAALGWIRVRLAGAGGGSADPRDAAAMIAAVIGLYALTALMRGEPQASGAVAAYAVAALICARWARDRIDLLCAVLAAVCGVGTEIILSAAGVFEYTDDVEQVAGVAIWLPALYLAYGVVAARLGSMLAERSGR
jgi:hypothetical protein